MIASVADTKSDLRARVRAARSRTRGAPEPESAAAGLLTTARAAGLLDPDGASDRVGVVAIAAYIAAAGEPDVAAIREAVRAAGGVVLLPIPRRDRTMDWALDDGRYRPEGRFPIEVPTGEVIGTGAPGLLAHGVATVLVPALAVDATGTRLGQGGGYYDRLLAEVAATAAGTRDTDRPSDHTSKAARVRFVAVVGDEELLPAGTLPREAHDQAVGAALTPTRFVTLGQ